LSLISNSSKFFCTCFFLSFFNVASFPSILRKISHPWGRFSFNWWQGVNWVVKQLMFTSNVQKPFLLQIAHWTLTSLKITNKTIFIHLSIWHKRKKNSMKKEEKRKFRPPNLAIPLAWKQNHS
jgi:hypothetical protein